MVRMCNRDTDVCAYHIPKGCKVQINMIAIHNDPELWGPEPVDQFVPERYVFKTVFIEYFINASSFDFENNISNNNRHL